MSEGARLKAREVKAMQMMMQGASLPTISKETGITTRTLQRRRSALRKVLKELDKFPEFLANRGNVLDAISLKILKTAMSPAKLSKATFSNLMYGYGITAQQSRLERGQPTNIDAQLRFSSQKPAIDVTPRSQEQIKCHENFSSSDISAGTPSKGGNLPAVTGSQEPKKAE